MRLNKVYAKAQAALRDVQARSGYKTMPSSNT